MMSVTGRARPAAPAGDALGDVEQDADAGLVVGEVDDHDPAAEPVQVEAPGVCSTPGATERRPSATWSARAPSAIAPAVAASAFATLCVASPKSVAGTSMQRHDRLPPPALVGDDPAVLGDHGAATPIEVAGEGAIDRSRGEEGRRGANVPGAPGHEWVVGVEHDLAVRRA